MITSSCGSRRVLVGYQKLAAPFRVAGKKDLRPVNGVGCGGGGLDGMTDD